MSLFDLLSVAALAASVVLLFDAGARLPALAAVVAAGEASAQLPEAIRALAAHVNGHAELRRTARRAMIYPVVVLVATSALVAFLLGGVVPQFAEIFASLHLSLPAVTVALIAISQAVRHGWPIGLVVVVLGVALFSAAARSPRLQRLRDRLLLRLPVLGEVIRHVATARFAAHCRLLHEAGIPLLEALRYRDSAPPPPARTSPSA